MGGALLLLFQLNLPASNIVFVFANDAGSGSDHVSPAAIHWTPTSFTEAQPAAKVAIPAEVSGSGKDLSSGPVVIRVQEQS
jgi:hypothetical protein